MVTVTELDLDALEAVANAATPGPWLAADEAPEWTAAQRVFAPELGDEQDDTICEAVEYKDAEHIATFDPPAVLALIARVRAAEATIERVRELHTARQVGWTNDPKFRLCVECDNLYPCPTVRALERDPS